MCASSICVPAYPTGLFWTRRIIFFTRAAALDGSRKFVHVRDTAPTFLSRSESSPFIARLDLARQYLILL